MSRLTHSPPALFLRYLWLFIRGRVHFPRQSIGDTSVHNGESYRVFRRMVVDPPLGESTTVPAAKLVVGFRFARFSPAANRRLSLIPIPFIAVQPGFRSKTWMAGEESGTFRGVYEWATLEHAEQYLDSFPIRMMKRRAAPGTLTTSVVSTEHGMV